MIKSLPSFIAAVILVSVLAAYMCTYQVRSTEVAIVKTFGEASKDPIRIDESDKRLFAGLHFKWPWPIQSAENYDTRIRLLNDRIEETPTIDNKQIILTTFTAWSIGDPYKFHTSYQTVEAGEDALRSRVRTVKKAVIGKHTFSDFVSTQQKDRKLSEIEQEMMQAIEADAREQFGIDIKMFGIKQLSLPKSVTEAVFTTMKTDKETTAQRYKSEGRAEANRIVATAEAKAERIRAVVDRKVAKMESKGLAEVGKIYSQFREHEELRIFLDKLRSLEIILGSRTEIFLDETTQPTDLFDDEVREELSKPK